VVTCNARSTRARYFLPPFSFSFFLISFALPFLRAALFRRALNVDEGEGQSEKIVVVRPSFLSFSSFFFSFFPLVPSLSSSCQQVHLEGSARCNIVRRRYWIVLFFLPLFFFLFLMLSPPFFFQVSEGGSLEVKDERACLQLSSPFFPSFFFSFREFSFSRSEY